MALDPGSPLTAVIPVTVTLNVMIDMESAMGYLLMRMDHDTINATIQKAVRDMLQESGLPAMNVNPLTGAPEDWTLVTLDTPTESE